MKTGLIIEKMLEKIAGSILAIDEASLTSLWNKYKARMERFDTTKEWEQSVIIFFIINAVRVKNHIFNEQMTHSQNGKSKRTAPLSRSKARLIRIK